MDAPSVANELVRETVVIAPISPGELVDKLTILEIKQERITDERKRIHIRRELDLLHASLTASDVVTDAVRHLMGELKHINETLWNIEDRLRAKDLANAFDHEFIELARSVYRTNDRRSAIKREINVLLQSELMEEKSYGNSVSGSNKCARSETEHRKVLDRVTCASKSSS
jgi:hypothetical protein